MERKLRRTGERLFVLWLLIGGLLLTTAVSRLQAQPTPADDPPLPLRGAGRDAPDRDPVIRQRQVLATGVQNTVVVIPATADTYLASERPNSNFGGDALYLGYNLVDDNYGAERILLRFDLDGTIPDNAIINDAHLRLRLNFSSPADDEEMGVKFIRLASAWDESGVTWNTEPAYGNEMVMAQGVGSAVAWYDWQITDWVADWADGAVANHGLEIIGDEQVQQRERAFYSRETAGDFYPRLVVDYTVSDDDQPPQIEVDDLPAYSGRTFNVSWSGTDPGSAEIDYYDVQYRTDGDDWQDWQMGVTITSTEFVNGENDRFYEFRARGVDDVGNVEPFADPEASTTVDTAAPTSQVDPLPTITADTSFAVSWSGSDGSGSGIAYYDVAYRVNNGDWLLWQNQTLATNTTFNAQQDGRYQFEVRAVDNLDQAEPFIQDAEATIVVDSQPPFVEPVQWLPLIFSGT